jgi:RNA polymerase sporulation-specific sigma factor
MSKELERQPTVKELADELEIDVAELAMALEANTDVESLQSVIHQGDGNPIRLIDKLDQDGDHETNMIDKIALRQVIDRLKPKEKQIIMMRYFKDKTQTEIAIMIGISQVQVSRIEKKVLKQMKEMFG